MKTLESPQMKGLKRQGYQKFWNISRSLILIGFIKTKFAVIKVNKFHDKRDASHTISLFEISAHLY